MLEVSVQCRYNLQSIFGVWLVESMGAEPIDNEATIYVSLTYQLMN